jgi:hypothetical protein
MTMGQVVKCWSSMAQKLFSIERKAKNERSL